MVDDGFIVGLGRKIEGLENEMKWVTRKEIEKSERYRHLSVQCNLCVAQRVAN